MKAFLTWLAVVLHKVPGFLLILAVFISMDGAQIIATWAGSPLAPYMAMGLKIVGYCTTGLTLLKQLKPGPLADAIDAGVKKADTKTGQAGFARLRALVMLSALGLVVLFVPAATCSTPAAQQAGQVALSTVPADAEFLMCEAAVVEADTAAKLPWTQAVTDSLANCTQDAIAIVNKLDGAVAQQVVSGKLSLADGQAAMVAIHAQLHLPPPVALTLPALKSKVGAR